MQQISERLVAMLMLAVSVTTDRAGMATPNHCICGTPLVVVAAGATTAAPVERRDEPAAIVES